MKSCWFFLLILLILPACGSEDPINTDIGIDYFPLKTGSQWIYNVEETSINLSVETKVEYELRVTVVDSIKNDLGLYTYIFLRETRATEMDAWQSLNTWSTMFSNNQVIQNEANLNLVKLIVPLFEGSRWNGNQYNNLPDNGNLFNGQNSATYQAIEFDKPVSLDTNLSFDKTTTVVQNDFTDPIVGTDQRKEVYARTVGLIYKEVIQLEYCTDDPCLGQQRVDKGVRYNQTLKFHASH